MSSRWTLPLLFLPWALAGCSPEPAYLAPARLGPVVASQHLVLAEASPGGPGAPTGRLLIVTPEAGRADAPRVIPLPGPPSLLVPVAGRPAVLALSRASQTVALVDVSGVVAASPGAASEGASGGAARAEVARSFDVGAPFEALTVDDDGHHALAWFPPDTASAVFHNENQVALIDLRADTPPARAVSRRTLPSLGGAPRVVAFSPSVVSGDGSQRRYLFALSDEHVAILAADAPDRSERSVPLVSLTTGGDRTPTGVVFGVDADASGASTLWAVVTTTEANAVYALALTQRADAADGEPDFDVHLSQLAGFGPGGTATLLEIPGHDGEAGQEAVTPRLATLATNPVAGTLTLTDVRTGAGQTLRLTPGVSRIARFTGARGTPEALVHAGRATSTFHVVDLLGLAKGDPRSYRTRTTRAPFSQVLPIPGTSRFVILDERAADGVGILDADTDRVTGFGRTGLVRDLRIAPDLGRLHALTSVDGMDFLVSVDLLDLHVETAAIPLGGQTLFSLAEGETVAVWARGAGGTLLLWPALDARDETSFALPAFSLTGLLD